MTEAHFEVYEEVPDVGAYFRLRAAAGLGALDLDGARTGLHNSLYAICVHLEEPPEPAATEDAAKSDVDDDADDGSGEVVAMGRIVGDGGSYFQVIDVVVAPEYRDLGLARMVLDPIDAWLAANAPAGSHVGYDDTTGHV